MALFDVRTVSSESFSTEFLLLRCTLGTPWPKFLLDVTLWCCVCAAGLIRAVIHLFTRLFGCFFTCFFCSMSWFLVFVSSVFFCTASWIDKLMLTKSARLTTDVWLINRVHVVTCAAVRSDYVFVFCLFACFVVAVCRTVSTFRTFLHLPPSSSLPPCLNLTRPNVN